MKNSEGIWNAEMVPVSASSFSQDDETVQEVFICPDSTISASPVKAEYFDKKCFRR